MNRQLRAERGCEKDSENPVFDIDCVRCGGTNPKCEVCRGSGIETFYRCPVKLVTNDTIRIMKYYNFFRKGYLPVAGGLLSQTAIFLESIEFLDQEVKSLQATEDK